MEENLLAAFLKMAGTLILVTAMIFMVIYLLKRFRLKSLSLKKIPEIRLISTLNLGVKKSIALVEVCDEWLVLGVGTQSVTLLTKLERPSQAADSLEIDSQGREKNRG